MDFLPVDVDRHVFAKLGFVQCLEGQGHDLFRIRLRCDVSRLDYASEWGTGTDSLACGAVLLQS